MSTELYKTHRPRSFKGVMGQEKAVAQLQALLARGAPSSFLLTGPSGCGKTTLGRIIRNKVGIADTDFFEVDCTQFRGIDMVRDIRRQMFLAPVGGGTARGWLIDEAHQLSKDAQNAFLKMLEDTPANVYFMLATTDDAKLLPTIKTRCSEVRVHPLKPDATMRLLLGVLEKEGAQVGEAVLDKVVEYAEGSARKALVLLESVLGLPTDDDRLAALESADLKPKAIELARALLGKAQWSEVQKILSGLVDEDPEGLRHMILGYASSCLLSKNPKIWARASLMIQAFERHFYDSKRPGLVNACYEVATR